MYFTPGKYCRANPSKQFKLTSCLAEQNKSSTGVNRVKRGHPVAAYLEFVRYHELGGVNTDGEINGGPDDDGSDDGEISHRGTYLGKRNKKEK